MIFSDEVDDLRNVAAENISTLNFLTIKKYYFKLLKSVPLNPTKQAWK